MLRILIADDHPIVREGLKQILSKSKSKIISDEASDGNEALDKALNSEFDVIFLDITMSGRNGMEVLKEIKQRKPDLPVLMLSMHPEEMYAVRALKSGASGYITKDSAPYILLDAISRVASGGKYISESAANELIAAIQVNKYDDSYKRLSGREQEIMLLVASGKRIKDIAFDLSLSEKTVSTYHSRVLTKLGVANDVELTRYVMENDLI